MATRIIKRLRERRAGKPRGGVVLGVFIALLGFEDDELSGLSAVSLAVSRSGILLSFQIQCVIRFRETDGSRQGNFCDVVAVEAGDICVVGVREGLLRLNHFDVVGYPRRETIARLLQGLSSEPDRILLNRNFLGGILQIEESVTHFL